jgi:hypothetical protein
MRQQHCPAMNGTAGCKASLGDSILAVRSFTTSEVNLDLLIASARRYAKSQALARELLASRFCGHRLSQHAPQRLGVHCVFRPALVTNVGKGGGSTVAFQKAGSPPFIT